MAMNNDASVGRNANILVVVALALSLVITLGVKEIKARWHAEKDP
jgi:hypothetical protein